MLTARAIQLPKLGARSVSNDERRRVQIMGKRRRPEWLQSDTHEHVAAC